MTDKQKGIILFAHGSPDPGWKKPMDEIQTLLSAKLGDSCMSRNAFLREIKPDIYTAALELIEVGAKVITVVPMFLAAGSHAMKDFPKIEKNLKERYPDILFEWTDVIGQWSETQKALAGAIATITSKGKR